ncbi:TetR/AcrR family transcriptional regulator [Kutzneria chonburiensis]|uniref:TetR/AcrR family transcriptional regulator n=1 Tax=Kutzneria chonburiensis TaxID=1483604 RepID=A0ABV6MME9_9PSEU|nr:TetR/AcrR family transcriptional regulator [Kutzneria chonburiensis]
MPAVRADALRNRARILAAAVDVFAEQGPEAALDDIAKRAAIGNATVYRHFADRGVLLHEVVRQVMTRTAEEAERALLAETEPFDALARFVHAVADLRITILCPLLAADDHDGLSELKQRVIDAVDELVTAAQDTGEIRRDVGFGDVLMALAQLTRPGAGQSWADIEVFAHRGLQVYLDGLLVESELPGRPAGIGDLRG